MILQFKNYSPYDVTDLRPISILPAWNHGGSKNFIGSSQSADQRSNQYILVLEQRGLWAHYTKSGSLFQCNCKGFE